MSKTKTRVTRAQKKAEAVRPSQQKAARQPEQAPARQVTPQAAYRRAQRNPNTLTSADLRTAQRAVGNRQVQRMLTNRTAYQALTPMPSETNQMVQMMRFVKWAGMFSWSKVERTDKELAPAEKKLRDSWQSYKQRFAALGATYQPNELNEQYAEIENIEVLTNAELKPIADKLQVFQEALKQQEEAKRRDEEQAQQDKLEKEFVRLRQEVMNIDQWLSQKAAIVPDDLITKLAERITKHLKEIKGLPAAFTASESHRIQPFMQAATHTVEQVFPAVQSKVEAWEKMEAAALEKLQKDRTQLLAELDQQHLAAERAYEDADSIVEVLDDIESELAAVLRDDTLAAETFDKKVDEWTTFYGTLRKERANRDNLANEAFKAQQKIDQLIMDAKHQLTGRPTTRKELEYDMKLLANTQKTVETVRGLLAKFTGLIQQLYMDTEAARKTFYYKMTVAEEKRSKKSMASGKVTAVHTDTAMYDGHDYVLIPKSANAYGRITANVDGRVKPLFEEAMTRGIIATYGRGQSGVKMRSAATYEIKVRRTNLEAKQASGVLRIENTNEPVAHDGKLFVTFNHAFEAH